ncbi:MAG TPA: multidrug efflux SMR transporter [Thermomicrobiales bacterium]|jgi:quaternary ammonium compound-resistance protein SugE|nr:multidrug efflux SMR transporter [Thermomicrobiales bacterium]
MLPWVLVFIAGLLEIGFAAALKQSDGLTEPLPTLVFVVLGTASFLVLSRALRWLPIGSAYAAWTGIGGAGTAIVGMLFLGEPVEVIRLVSIALILSGVVGLQLSGGGHDRGKGVAEVQPHAARPTGEIMREI